MASSVFVNGRVTSTPGSYSTVDASGLSRVGLNSRGIVAVVGESEGGEPLAVLAATSPSKAAAYFRDGDLLDSVDFLFNPSADDDISGGVSQAKFVKVNPATQSAETFANGDGDALTLTSVDYGLFTTQINVEIAAGSNQGKAITIAMEDTIEAYDDVGGDTVFSIEYTPGSTGATTMTTSVDPDVGVYADFTKSAAGLDSDYDGTLTGAAGNLDEQLATIGSGDKVDVVSSSVADTTQKATIYGVDSVSGDPVSETLTLTGTVPVTGTTTWSRVHGFVLSAACAGNVTVKDNVGAVALHTINAGATSIGGGVDVLAAIVEISGSVAKVKADGASTAKMLIIGTDTSDVAQLEELTLNGATYVVGTATWNSVVAVAVGYVATARNLTLQGLIWNQGGAARIVSDSASDVTQTITIYGVDGSGDEQSETLTLTGTGAVVGTATWKRVYGAVLSALTVGTIQVGFDAGVGTAFSWDGSASKYAGVRPWSRVYVDGTAVSIVADGTTTRKVMLIGLNLSGSAQIEELTLNSTTPVLGAALWREITGIAVGHLQAARTATTSGDAFDLPKAAYNTVQKVADYINSKTGWVATIVTTKPTTFLIANMDYSVAQNVLSASEDYLADLNAIVEIINEESELVSATRAINASGPPSNTTSPVYLSGGVEGTTTNQDWSDALTLLQDEEVSTVVLLTSDATVHALGLAHCEYMAAGGRGERDMVIGAQAGVTLAQAKVRARNLGSRHARLCTQEVYRANRGGEMAWWSPSFTALLAAGMQAGTAEVGTPLTNKYVRVEDVRSDSSYNVRSDSDEIINSGLHVIDRVRNIGFRWLRGVTTHLANDNPAYVEASVNEAVNRFVKSFREALEAAVGRRGFAGTINAAMSIAIQAADAEIASGAITSWRNIQIDLTSDVMTVDIEISPVEGVNFVLCNVHLVTSTFAASA